MEEITRFDMDMDGSMVPSDYGQWVRYEAITAMKELLAQPEQEPVAWWNQSKDSVSTDPVHRHNSDCQPLYTAPPQRKPLRTVIYACPICAASLERQE